MDYIVWLPAALLSGIVLATYYANRYKILNLFNELQDWRLFSSHAGARERKQVYLVQSPERPNLIPKEAIKEGISALAEHIKDVRPDWIAGLNLGGRLLSTYVAERIKFSADRVLFIQLNDKQTAYEFVPQLDSIARKNQLFHGTLLVVDDITRTGNTFRSVRSFIVSLNFSNRYTLSRVRFATLLEWSETAERTRPDWSWRLTPHQYIEFPWSELSSAMRDARGRLADPQIRTAGDESDSRTLEKYRKMAQHYRFAVTLAHQFLD